MANPAKAGDAKPWVYSHPQDGNDRQAAEDQEIFLLMTRKKPGISGLFNIEQSSIGVRAEFS